MFLVKNLPSGVQVGELEALFSPHGSLGRVLLPPSGLTAIVEFLEPTEAKRAFMKLAYTKVSVCDGHLSYCFHWKKELVYVFVYIIFICNNVYNHVCLRLVKA